MFPALAVATALREQNIPVVWVGTERGIESTLVPDWGFPLQTITVTALRGNGLLKRVRSLVTLVGAVWNSIAIIRRTRPRAVLGMGGYVSGPVCLAARLCGRRMVLHEQNAVAGFTNKILNRFAATVMEAMPGAFRAGRAAVHTGNPVRSNILGVEAPAQRMAGRTGAKRVLVIGGSQGAKALNELVPQSIALLDEPVEVRHQTGERWIEQTTQAYAGSSHPVQVISFIDDMADAYRWADLIICRSGAMTVAEISAVGLASILVPFPSAVDDHQTVNGQYLVDHGAAVMQQESQLTAEGLASQISALVRNRETLITMAEKGRNASRRDATQRVVDNILENV